jgi:hypothetical protein
MNKKIDIEKIPITQLIPYKKHSSIEYKKYIDQHYSSDDSWVLNYVKNIKLKQK